MFLISIDGLSVLDDAHDDILSNLYELKLPKTLQFGFRHVVPYENLPIPSQYNALHCSDPENCEGIGCVRVIIFDWEALVFPGSPNGVTFLPGVLDTLFSLRETKVSTPYDVVSVIDLHFSPLTTMFLLFDLV